ncbi:unnamed protein product [Didymodactylos carnosus]|uniref:Uncharacterized protein n=1 Tax=Didymodactylos carnosus TaxID=1234261 RepID=A0A8S2W023_9BILA|nr:unnamed protein product [Didymodactylos carnosus]CAF4417060.1 unnamed protein product [Didymodactylos carnosus]
MWDSIAATCSDMPEQKHDDYLKKRRKKPIDADIHVISSKLTPLQPYSSTANVTHDIEMSDNEMYSDSDNEMEYIFDTADDGEENMLKMQEMFITDDNESTMFTDNDEIVLQRYDPDSRPLHPYTTVKTSDANEIFVKISSQGSLSKVIMSSILKEVKNMLPLPNNFPKNVRELLNDMGITNRFSKKTYCCECSLLMDRDRKLCENSNCKNFHVINPDTLSVFDGDVHFLLKTVVARNIQEIDRYSNKNPSIFDDDIVDSARYHELL